MSFIIKIFFSFFFFFQLLTGEFEVSLRDISYIKGIKKNVVSGVGLIVGLEGSGDSRNLLTRDAVQKYLSHHGLHVNERDIVTKNTALVALSAETFGLLRKGDILDVHAASLNDAKNIENGLLLPSTLRGGDGTVYVVASGIVITGKSGQGLELRRGIIPGGGIIEQTIGGEGDYFKDSKSFSLVFNQPSLETMVRVQDIIRAEFPSLVVTISDLRQMKIASEDIPITYSDVAKIQNLQVKQQSRPRIVIDRKSGVVVVSEQVRIDTAFISMPGFNAEVGTQQNEVSKIINSAATVGDLAKEFNSIGIQPSDISVIFTALAKCGAINADIIIQ